jgi:uncharacterized protein
MRLFAFIMLPLALCSCVGESTVSIDEYNTRLVKLPRGQKIRVEVMGDPRDMARGMMFRDSLAPDRGMLFVYGKAGKYPHWMYQVRIPLDMIWLDKDRRIVEIVAQIPPCTSTSAKECPPVGGHETAITVLELASGMAEKYGLKTGNILDY